MNELHYFLPILFPLFFLGNWFFVMFILSRLSGWSDLAEQCHYPEKFQGKVYGWQSARIKKVNWNNALNIGVNETGLYLTPMILFRPFHKPVLIPWGEIETEPTKRFLFKGYRLTILSCPGSTIELPKQTFERMIQYLKTQTGLGEGGES